MYRKTHSIIYVTKSGGLAGRHSKANKEASLVERKVCFILDASNWWGKGRLLSKGQFPTTTTSGQEHLQVEGGGYMQKQHSQLGQSSWNWSCGGLTSVILIVLSIDTINLQFQGRFVPIFLRPILGIVAAYVMATVWSSCS